VISDDRMSEVFRISMALPVAPILPRAAACGAHLVRCRGRRSGYPDLYAGV